MNCPPRAAQWILRTCASDASRVFVEQDLSEEFHSYQSPMLGAQRARRWYWRQTVHSAWPMLQWWIQNEQWDLIGLALLVATAGQLRLMDAFWSEVLSQVPLKEGAERGPLYAFLSLVLTIVLTGAVGSGLSYRSIRLLLPIALGLCWTSLGGMTGQMRPWFMPATMLCCFAGLSGQVAFERMKRRRA